MVLRHKRKASVGDPEYAGKSEMGEINAPGTMLYMILMKHPIEERYAFSQPQWTLLHYSVRSDHRNQTSLKSWQIRLSLQRSR